MIKYVEKILIRVVIYISIIIIFNISCGVENDRENCEYEKKNRSDLSCGLYILELNGNLKPKNPPPPNTLFTFCFTGLIQLKACVRKSKTPEPYVFGP